MSPATYSGGGHLFNVIIAPDSFKGTLSAFQVCSIISAVLKEKYPDCKTVNIPIADGGEGTAEAYQNIFTGEGKMDEQSLMGKAPLGVAKRSGKTKVIAVVGLLDADREKVRQLGISEVIETNPLHLPFEQVKDSAKENLKIAAKKIKI